MTHNVSLPTKYSASQWMRPTICPGHFLPRLPSLGLPATMCGLLAIATLIAPEWVDSIIPHFRERYLPVVSIIIALSLLGALWRLVKATVGLLFFGAAALALLYTVYGGTLKGFSLPNFISTPQTSALRQPPTQKVNGEHAFSNPVASILPRPKLPPALPDEAYFPKPKSADDVLGLEQFGGLNQISGYLRGLAPRGR